MENLNSSAKYYVRSDGTFIATYYGGGEPDEEFIEVPESPPLDGSQVWLFPGWSEFVPPVVEESNEEKLQRLIREVGELQKEMVNSQVAPK